jgi:hypothetical protein
VVYQGRSRRSYASGVCYESGRHSWLRGSWRCCRPVSFYVQKLLRPCSAPDIQYRRNRRDDVVDEAHLVPPVRPDPAKSSRVQPWSGFVHDVDIRRVVSDFGFGPQERGGKSVGRYGSMKGERKRKRSSLISSKFKLLRHALASVQAKPFLIGYQSFTILDMSTFKCSLLIEEAPQCPTQPSFTAL